ncbi:aminotransferase [Ruegeria arenilitoris]|uniref:aminotransferase n=1 Tax=Ruegeria arenilitoris TaxID=1173585 RepID=UPI00147FF566|nr:aminotransferase [Ruegeria arenilitoris]
MKLTRTAATFAPPVMEASRWLQGVSFTVDRPLINVSQAAPVDPPPLALRQAMAEFALRDNSAHLYGPVLGNDDLRAELASQISVHYASDISKNQVAITSGCNQAFSAVISAISNQGDEVILPTPWYFNHKMWLDMAGVGTVTLATGDSLLPNPDKARELITEKTRAIVLVTPNNPGGVEYPADLVMDFFELARSAGIHLLVDETYRDFDSRSVPPHDLFQQPSWDNTLVHLYSFSKAYRLTGHRVGAVASAPALLSEIEKFLDTIAICPSQIGQFAALWGMQNLPRWVSEERNEILDRRALILQQMPRLSAKGWRLLGLGAYFAYLEHPFDLSSDILAKRLVVEAAVLLLPGTMFMPVDDPDGKRQLRIAFANLDKEGISRLFDRLEALSF